LVFAEHSSHSDVNEEGHYVVPEREAEYKQWKASLPKHEMSAAVRR
jgi:hypothetical protein